MFDGPSLDDGQDNTENLFSLLVLLTSVFISLNSMITTITRNVRLQKHTEHQMCLCKKIYVGIVIGKQPIEFVTTSTYSTEYGICFHAIACTLHMVSLCSGCKYLVSNDLLIFNSALLPVQSSLCGAFWIL